MRRVAWLLLATVLLIPVVSACSAGADPNRLPELLPTTLLDRGALWRADDAAVSRTLRQLGLSADRLRAAVVTGAPTVALLDHPDSAEVPDRLGELGYAEVSVPGEWRRFDLQGPAGPDTVGLPSVGVADGLVVTGSAQEVASVLDDGAQRARLPVRLDDRTVVALLGTSETAAAAGPAEGEGRMPAFSSYVVTAQENGSGVVALAMDDPTQQDAVEVAVRLRTGIVGEGIAVTSLLRADGPLAGDGRVVVAVEWLGEPTQVLGDPTAPLVGILGPLG